MTTDAARTGRGPWLGAVIVGAAVVAVVAGLGIAGFLERDGSPGSRWVSVGSIEVVRRDGVLFVRELDAYVVAEPSRAPITLVARSPQMGEKVVYCESSTWFEDPAHGSKFDRLGRYALGPAPRGLDRLPTTVRDGIVWVDPSHVLLGPPREEHASDRPAGPFCSGSG